MSGHKSEKKGPNIICRVSNVTPEMVCRYVERLPKQKMTEEAFRKSMGKRWFQNEHQAPEQWGLYYIDGTNYYPRFNHDITIEEADAYLYNWMRNLIVVNPYTRFKKQSDKKLVESIVSQLEKNPDEHDLKTIIRRIIDSEEPFVINEIIANALNKYSRVLKVEIINKDEERYNVSLLPNYKELLKSKNNMTKKEYFELFDDVRTAFDPNAPLQQIFYGAPGTGKSNTIKRETEVAEKEGRVFRTTFHPDSDYSTFVGCYKPSMKSSERVYSLEELTAKLKEIKTSGTTYPCHKFGAKYWKSLKDLSAENIKRILTACGFTETMNVEVSKGIAIGQEYLNNSEDGRIIYSFVPQAFTNAYVKAWNTEEDVYLIIEEINRGNCAQIFGDLFQLLDRKDGKSEYPIIADTDLRNYLSDELANSTRNDFPEDVKEGKKLVLPPNLYIWATMNTSDQSLFPIDSAFKRRWDWVYIPISASDEDNFGIKVGRHFYDWGKFISQMNRVVANVTSSEDKQLGYYFCKADEDGNIISANRFVNKVLFYLWNDVFKNYGFDATLDGKAVFKYKNDEDKDETMSFTSFYISNGMPNVKQIKRLMENLGLEGVNEWPAEKAEEDSSDGTVKLLSVKYEGNAVEGASHKEVFLKTLELIVKDRDADEVARVIGSEMTKNPPSPSETTRNYVKVGDSDWYVATRNGKDRFLRHLINLANNLELNLVAQ
jgi:hypothetical protein